MITGILFAVFIVTFVITGGIGIWLGSLYFRSKASCDKSRELKLLEDNFEDSIRWVSSEKERDRLNQEYLLKKQKAKLQQRTLLLPAHLQVPEHYCLPELKLYHLFVLLQNGRQDFLPVNQFLDLSYFLSPVLLPLGFLLNLSFGSAFGSKSIIVAPDFSSFTT